VPPPRITKCAEGFRLGDGKPKPLVVAVGQPEPEFDHLAFCFGEIKLATAARFESLSASIFSLMWSSSFILGIGSINAGNRMVPAIDLAWFRQAES
jgi:hypothetical protein